MSTTTDRPALVVPPPPTAGAGAAGRRRRWNRQSTAYALLLVPALVLLVGLVLYPIVLSVVTSFKAGNSATFIGLGNYRKFFDNPQAASIIGHTFTRGIGGVLPSYLLGILAAVSLHQKIKGRTVLRVLVLVPFVISAPVGLNMWRILLDPFSGVPTALGWDLGDPLANPDLVWPTLLIINAWASFQFYTIVLLAGLSRIPDELYEAAETDGATRWQRLRHITLPGIGAVGGAACVVHFMASFQEFNLIWILTGGGPLGTTQTMATFAYAKAFSDYDTGYATATTTISMVIMVLTLAVGYVLVRLLRPVWTRAKRSGTLPSLRLPARRHRPTTSPRRRRQRRTSPVPAYLGTAVVLVISLLPILFIVSRAFDSTPGGLEAISLLPRHWSLENFRLVLTDPALWGTDSLVVPPLARNFLNSIVVSIVTTLLVLVVGMLGGYALSRWRSRWTRAGLGLLVLLQLVPVIVLVFPLYDLLAKIGLLGTLTGLVLATSALFLPIATLLFKVFFDGLPREVEESASIDGASTVRLLFSIVAPMSRPVIGAVASYTLINTWNEYLLSTTLISDLSSRTFPPALQQYMSSYSFKAQTTPGMQAVYLLLPIIAAVLLLTLTQRHLATAYQGGSVKG
jgi:ABC-type sugar transport system permease subunit